MLSGKGDGSGSRESSSRPAKDNSAYNAGSSYEEPQFNPDDEIPFS